MLVNTESARVVSVRIILHYSYWPLLQVTTKANIYMPNQVRMVHVRVKNHHMLVPCEEIWPMTIISIYILWIGALKVRMVRVVSQLYVSK